MMSKLLFSRRAVRRLVVPAVLLALLGAACTDSTPVETVVLPSTTGQVTAPPTTSDPNEAVILGSGSIPDTMPTDFPIPAEAVIGTTLIDRNRNLTELIMRLPAGVEVAAEFFTTNLPNRGYTVDSSTGDAARWDLAVSGAGITATVAITLASQDIAQVVVTVTADS